MRLSYRPVHLLATAVFALALLIALLVAALAPPAAAAGTVTNAAGRYDGLVLRDLGGKTAALVQLVAEDGAFTPVELWRSKKGAFDVARATFVAGDVNGDGIGDGIVLYDLGRSRSRLLIFRSDGSRARQTTAWTSRAGALSRSRARIAVGDANGDGLDDVLALYDRGRGSAALYRFTSTGTKFRQSLVWSARRGYACAGAQLAAGDATGDGRADAVVLYRSTSTSSRLDVFVAGSSKFSKKTFWRGKYAAGRARLAAGDVDSDGDCDAVCLYRQPDGNGRLDVFASSGKSFAPPAAWYSQAGGPLVPVSGRFCVGDITGDGRSDVVTAASAGASVTRLSTWVSTGAAFAPQTWWEGAWPFSRVRLAVAPATGLVVAEGTEVLGESALRSLRRVQEDGTLTFAGMTGQLSRLEAGDVVLSGVTSGLPQGMCRKVTSVGEVGGRVVVETEPAPLSDVIDQGEVAFSLHVTADDLADDGIRAPGVRIVREESTPGTLPPALGGANGEGLHFTLTSTILGFAEGEGDIWLDPNAYCDWDIGWSGLNWASYTQELNASADLTLSCKKSYTGTKETTIYKRTLSVVTIMVGPVPVVVTPVFEVKLGVEGEITAGVTAGMTLDATASVGISYDDDDGWDSSAGADVTATPHPPQLFGGVTVTGYANVGLAFMIYGVAGPEAALKPYVELDAAANADPWWTLTGGLKGVVGFKVEALDTELLSKEFELDLWSLELDRAGSAGSGGGSSDYHAPSIRGAILDTTTGEPIRGAYVVVDAGGSQLAQTTSAADGGYVFFGLSPGAYTVSADKDRYAANTRGVTVASGQTTLGQDVRLTRSEFQGIEGHVYHEAGGSPMFAARVRLYEVSGSFLNARGSYTTGADGYYKLEDVVPGTYRLEAADQYDWYYFEESVTVIVTGDRMLTQDFSLVGKSTQGVSGWVVDDLTGDPLQGAIVNVRDRAGDGFVVEDGVLTGADGSFVVTGLPVGTHWALVSLPGYEDRLVSFAVRRGEITTLGTVELKEVGGLSMRAPGQDAWIRWSEGVSSWGWGTYEFWFRPTAWGVMEYGNVLAEISKDYPDWNDEGPHRLPIMRIQYATAAADPDDVVVEFAMNENKGDLWGAWHRVKSTTPLELGRWYHIAAVYGEYGMKLFVNGRLEGADEYGGKPEANPGADPGGWFSLGGNDTFPGYQSAMGDYKGVCVYEEAFWDSDFTPPDTPWGGGSAIVYDTLVGTTNGENGGFVPTP